MKLRSTNRIYLEGDFLSTHPIILHGNIAHYMRNVLRLKVNNNIRLFNQFMGEYLAKIIICDKKVIHLELIGENRVRIPVLCDKLSIAPCLIKNDKFSNLVDMSVQLGVTDIIPVISKNTVFKNCNTERMNRIIIEAVEQSERFDPPIISEPVKLENIDFAKYDAIIYADENLSADIKPDLKILQKKDILLLTGPEGGFAENERDFLSKLPNGCAISLGANILRAETAMVKLVSYIKLARSLK